MSYTLVSVAKPSGASPGFQKPMDELILFRVDDVATMPDRDDKGIKVTANLVMKAGKNMISIYCTPGTLKYGQVAEGDPDSRAFVQSIEGQYPGYDLAIAEFMENNKNENLMALVRFCDGVTDPKLFGGPCAPLQMEPTLESDNQKTMNTLALKSQNKGPAIAIYTGTIVVDGSGSGA